VKRASPPLEGHALAGAHERVRELFHEHFDFIWRVLRRLGLGEADADDAIQEVFMIAAQKLDVIGDGKAKSFLYGIAVRVASNARRTTERRRERLLGEPDEWVSEAPGAEERLELHEAWALLDELLDRMPPELRRVLVLVDIEQAELVEIAELEGIPLGTASSRVRRARKEFDTMLARVRRRNPFAKVTR
jgi:RNA polymerase sigma-70 factor (ECF subfamily)